MVGSCVWYCRGAVKAYPGDKIHEPSGNFAVFISNTMPVTYDSSYAMLCLYPTFQLSILKYPTYAPEGGRFLSSARVLNTYCIYLAACIVGSTPYPRLRSKGQDYPDGMEGVGAISRRPVYGERTPITCLPDTAHLTVGKLNIQYPSRNSVRPRQLERRLTKAPPQNT